MIFLERRKHKREPNNGELEFIKITGTKEVINRGELLDESPAGLGLKTGFPLLNGQPVIVRLAREGEALKYGVVCWSERSDGFYRSGIRFIFNNL